MGNNKGYQIMELIIVLLLAAIIFGMVLTIGLRGVASADYNGAVNKLLAEISYVKQLAALENKYAVMQFSPNGYSYTILVQDSISDTSTFNKRRDGYFYEQSRDEFFDKTKYSDYSFAVNSMGMVFKRGDIGSPNPVPSSITIPVFFKDDDGAIDETDTITINPSGGVYVN